MTSAGTRAATLVLSGPLSREDVPALSERACALLGARRHELCYCLLVELNCDLAAVEAIARLVLTARRNDCEMRFLGALARLCELMEILGLAQLMGSGPIRRG